MARLYLAGPAHTPHDRAALEAVEAAAADLGHEVFAPHRGAPTSGGRPAFAARLAGLGSCDAAIALLDGADADAGTALEVGLAHALHRPLLGLRSDARALANPLLAAACRDVATVEAWTPEALQPRLRPFLATVRVFAGTLVRDGVPKLLEAEGQALKFRPVGEKEYPAVLKRKLVEATRRLEESEFGLEQEEIADLLELLETLINLRRYDKESLRSIKEGKWRKRGGFERGFLLEEEPRLSSR